ncbi:MAG: uracil phosphoribosyltransferase, partial [Spirochaetia bacterium]|nr:uracil phosphoribosyltransferase [Spirochaetia bacterium]
MSDNKIILKAEDLDGYLTADDMADLKTLDTMFKDTMKSFEPVDEEKIVEGYDKMGKKMQEICA